METSARMGSSYMLVVLQWHALLQARGDFPCAYAYLLQECVSHRATSLSLSLYLSLSFSFYLPLSSSHFFYHLTFFHHLGVLSYSLPCSYGSLPSSIISTDGIFVFSSALPIGSSTQQ